MGEKFIPHLMREVPSPGSSPGQAVPPPKNVLQLTNDAFIGILLQLTHMFGSLPTKYPPPCRLHRHPRLAFCEVPDQITGFGLRMCLLFRVTFFSLRINLGPSPQNTPLPRSARPRLAFCGVPVYCASAYSRCYRYRDSACAHFWIPVCRNAGPPQNTLLNPIQIVLRVTWR